VTTYSDCREPPSARLELLVEFTSLLLQTVLAVIVFQLRAGSFHSIQYGRRMTGLMKDFKPSNNKDNPSENGSNFSSSNGEGGGNNSDNSGLISIGNTSFGFNFDSEEGNNSSSSRNSSGNSEEGDSDQDGKPKSNGGKIVGRPEKQQQQRKQGESKPPESQQVHIGGTPQPESATSDLPPLSRPSKPHMTPTLSAGAAAAKISSDSSRATSSFTSSTRSSSHSDAAAAAVAYLQSIADASNKASASGKEF
jgi:hypothetical protein